MSLIGIINSDEELQSRIDKIFKTRRKRYQLQRVATETEIQELLNFELPEIVIINCSDTSVPLQSIIHDIHEDSWLHNFGIIAIFDRKTMQENDVAQMLKDVNLLCVLEYSSMNAALMTNVEIIEQNRQIIFQWEMMGSLSNRLTGSFQIENNPMVVPVYAGLAATALVQRGYLRADKKRNLQIALAELILNGIEHGNCGLNFEEKTQFLMEGGSITELVERKCQDPAVAAKRVYLEWDIRDDHTRFFVKDEGEGFDVLEYQVKMKTRKKDALHGRGILMAKSFGGRLAYNRKGNTAVLTVQHDTAAAKSEPLGFKGEEVLMPQKGDIIFQQGDISDYIYYISSGSYTVYHDDVAVGVLTPADIFMGEMSFLLSHQRSATVVADVPGKIIKISRKTFVSVMRQYPQYAVFLAKLLALKIARSNQAQAQKARTDWDPMNS